MWVLGASSFKAYFKKNFRIKEYMLKIYIINLICLGMLFFALSIRFSEEDKEKVFFRIFGTIFGMLIGTLISASDFYDPYANSFRLIRNRIINKDTTLPEKERRKNRFDFILSFIIGVIVISIIVFVMFQWPDILDKITIVMGAFGGGMAIVLLGACVRGMGPVTLLNVKRFIAAIKSKLVKCHKDHIDEDKGNKKILQLVSDDFEDVELWCPIMRLREAGAIVDLAAEKPGKYHGKHGVSCEVEMSFKDVESRNYDGILIPGGWAPDKLRRIPKVLELVREMNRDGKLIGQICHAGWVLASAEILEGRKVTSTPAIRDDLMHAGAIWLDEPCVVDGNLVSARRPLDIPEYEKQLVKVLFGE